MFLSSTIVNPPFNVHLLGPPGNRESNIKAAPCAIMILWSILGEANSFAEALVTHGCYVHDSSKFDWAEGACLAIPIAPGGTRSFDKCKIQSRATSRL